MRPAHNRKDRLRFQVAYEIISNRLMPKEVAGRLKMNIHTVDYYWRTAQQVIRGEPITP